MEKKPRSLGTHNGTFHADEVSACALLLLFDLIDRAYIIRTRNQDLLDCCEFVCDVGGRYDPSSKRFDHHQADYSGPLSSAGMVLRYLLESGKIDKAAYDAFNHSLIMGVDAHDNGIDPLIDGVCTFSQVIANFTPIHYDATPKEQDSAFGLALDFVLSHLQRFWGRYRYVLSCKEMVKEAMDKGSHYLFFEKAIPWLDLFFEMGGEDHPASFIVMPTGDQWKLRAIPPTYQQRMGVRIPLPQEWAGLLEEELKQVSGISGAVFCHKGRFTSVWQSKEDALRALEYVLKKEGK